MAKIIVRLTTTAFADLDEIEEYISRDSPSIARRFIEKILSRLSQLENFPNSGRIVPEFADESLRELIEGKYRIVYKLNAGQVIVILRVVHGARLLEL